MAPQAVILSGAALTWAAFVWTYRSTEQLPYEPPRWLLLLWLVNLTMMTSSLAATLVVECVRALTWSDW